MPDTMDWVTPPQPYVDGVARDLCSAGASGRRHHMQHVHHLLAIIAKKCAAIIDSKTLTHTNDPIDRIADWCAQLLSWRYCTLSVHGVANN